jgi:carbonic anhydrase
MLEDFYRANAAFVARRRASPPVDIPPKAKLAIVSCMDHRLATLLPDALGLARGDAYQIANAGNTSTRWDESILRSVAVAVLAGGVRHVAVIGHTECRMAGDTLPLIDAMRDAGVPRDAFGDRDPREWFGALGGIESNVRNIVETLKRSPLLPASVALYGLLIDTASGEIRAIVSETTIGHGDAGVAVMTPRQGGSLEEVLGGNVQDIQRPTGAESPAGAPPTSETSSGQDAAGTTARTPRQGGSLEEVLGIDVRDIQRPDAGKSPGAGAVPSADAARATISPSPSAVEAPDFRRKADAEPPKPEPPRPPEPPPRPEPPRRANVRREYERDRKREKSHIPLDPREAQEFFRKRQRERQRKKRRDFGL